MFDMLKTIILDVLGIKPAPAQPVYYTPVVTGDQVAAARHITGSTLFGDPVYDSTGIVRNEDNFGIL
jgi:hypothetical protein